MNKRAWRQSAAALAMASAVLAAPALAGQDPNGKTTAANVRQEVGDAARTIKDYSVEQRDEALRKTKAALDDLDARIEHLERSLQSRWSRMDEAAKEKATGALHALRRDRNTAAEWYGGLKHGSAEAWERTKKGFSEAFDALRGTWQKTEKEVGDGP